MNGPKASGGSGRNWVPVAFLGSLALAWYLLAGYSSARRQKGIEDARAVMKLSDEVHAARAGFRDRR